MMDAITKLKILQNNDFAEGFLKGEEEGKSKIIGYIKEAVNSTREEECRKCLSGVLEALEGENNDKVGN